MDIVNSENNQKVKYINYFRVSSQRQGISGLGLEAQRQAVQNYVRNNIVVAEFTEIETGTKKKHRPEIHKAIELCKKEGATLLIAKIDRLSRNLAFIVNLLDSGVDFIATDMPQANRLTVHILAAIAEHEALIIKTRTKAALAIAKQRGKKLGNPQNFTQEAREKGANQRRENAIENKNNMRATTIICLLKEQIGISYSAIARKLNTEGFPTSTGKLHTSYSVWLLWKRHIYNTNIV